MHVDEQIQKVKNEIKAGKLYHEKEKSGDKLIKQVLKMIHKKPAFEKFYVTDNCIKCKICEKVCSRGNITINVCGSEFGDKCEGYLACVYNCPQKAIRVKREKIMLDIEIRIYLLKILYIQIIFPDKYYTKQKNSL